MLKNTPAYRQAGICSVIRPPHRFGGVAGSPSLFVTTPPLILPLASAYLPKPRRRQGAFLSFPGKTTLSENC